MVASLLPSSVADAVSRLDKGINAPTSLVGTVAANAQTPEWERVETRKRRCHAAWRYLLDPFDVPLGTIPQEESYYVNAFVVSPKLAGDDGGSSRALEWHPRLQGLLVAPSR